MSATTTVPTSLQYLVTFRNGRDYKSNSAEEGDVPVIGSGGAFTTTNKHLYDGESVLFGRKGTLDRPLHVTGKFWTVDTMYYTELQDGVHGRWLYYWATTIPFDLYSTNTAVPSMTSSVLGRLPVEVPNFQEQRRIADFLDRETAEIDAMDADLDRLIEALQERRMISIAERLAGIPTTAPFKYVIRTRFAGDWGRDAGQGEVDVPCVRVADFDREANTVSDNVPTIRSLSQKSFEAKRLHPGDLLLEKSGGSPAKPVGNVMLYTGGDSAVCTNFIECIRLRDSEEPRYWLYAHQLSYSNGFTHQHVRQTTGIQNLDTRGLLDEWMPRPPLEEQRRIADHLDRETAEIDSMIADARRLKEVLAERRSVLISDVVTGRKEVPA